MSDKPLNFKNNLNNLVNFSINKNSFKKCKLLVE